MMSLFNRYRLEVIESLLIQACKRCCFCRKIRNSFICVADPDGIEVGLDDPCWHSPSQWTWRKRADP